VSGTRVKLPMSRGVQLPWWESAEATTLTNSRVPAFDSLGGVGISLP
jgi:hypothetical protein